MLKVSNRCADYPFIDSLLMLQFTIIIVVGIHSVRNGMIGEPGFIFNNSEGHKP